MPTSQAQYIGPIAATGILSRLALLLIRGGRGKTAVMNQLPLAATGRATRRMFVRDLVVNAHIGVYAHEQGRTQRVRVNLDLTVEDLPATGLSRPGVGADDLNRVVDYDSIINSVRDIIAAGHVQLVETLAERVAESCLQDPRILTAKVMVEKLDVFPDAGSVGVEIKRSNSRFSTPRNPS